MDFKVFFEQTRNRFRSIRRLIFLLNNGTATEEIKNSPLSRIQELGVLYDGCNNPNELDPDLISYVSVHRDKSQLVCSSDCDWTNSSFHELADEACGIVYELLEACVREQMNKKGNRFKDDERENWSVAICVHKSEGNLPGEFFDAIAKEFMTTLNQHYPWVTSSSWQIHVDKGLESEEKTARAAWMPHKQMLAQTNRSKDTNTGESQETAEKTKKVTTPKSIIPHEKHKSKLTAITQLEKHHCGELEISDNVELMKLNKQVRHYVNENNPNRTKWLNDFDPEAQADIRTRLINLKPQI